MLFRILNLIHKEFIQLFRDRLLAPFVLLGPLSELLLIAWSTSQGIDHLPTAVLDLDLSPASRALVTAMENAETFDPYYVTSLDDITSDITTGRAMAAWVIPAGFQAQLLAANEGAAPVGLIVDGADVLAVQTAVEVGQGVAASYGAGLRPETGAVSNSPLTMSLRVWFNEEMKESNYMIPSELGFIAAAIAPLFTLANLDEVTLTVYVPEAELGKVALGQSVQVTVDAYDEQFTGEVSYLASQAEFTPSNVQTQAERVHMVFAVKIRLANSDHLLKPGMPADAVFE